MSSHTSTMARRVPAIQYPRKPAVQVVALALGVKRSTAAQMLKMSDERSPWSRAARATRALKAAGHGLLAERLKLEVDVACAVPVPWSVALLYDEEDLDNRENMAGKMLAVQQSPATWSTYRKILVDYVALAHELILSGDAQFGDTR